MSLLRSSTDQWRQAEAFLTQLLILSLSWAFKTPAWDGREDLLACKCMPLEDPELRHLSFQKL